MDLKNSGSLFAHIAHALVVLFLVAALPLTASAKIYGPGETLNPECLPTDLTCTVATSITATTTSTLATTTISDLTVPGNTTLQAATSTSFFSTVIDAITGVINSLTTGSIAATSSLAISSATTTMSGALGIGTLTPTEMLHVQGNAFISGGLTVMGTTTSVGVTNLDVVNKNIYLASSTSPTDAIADGGGIVLMGTTNKTISWVNSSQLWEFSHGLKVNATSTTSQFGGALLVSGNTTLATTTASNLSVTGTSTAAISLVSGKLAIGTTTPGTLLHVVGAGNQARIQGTSASDVADIIFNNASDTTSGSFNASTWQISRRGNGDFQFANYPSNVFTPRLTLTNTGLLTVGTTTVSNFTATATSTLATTTATGLTITQNGISFASSSPISTSSTLYALGSRLFWNGSMIETGSTTVSGANGEIQFTDGDGRLISTSTFKFATSTGIFTVAATSTFATTTISTLGVTNSLAIGTTTAGSVLHVVGAGAQARIQGVAGVDQADLTFNNASDTNGASYSTSTWKLSRLANGTFSIGNFPGASFFSRFSIAQDGSVAIAGTSTLATTTASGLTLSQNGLTIASSTPFATSSTLYAIGNTLYWDGSRLGQNATGTPGLLQFADGLGGFLATSSLSFATSTGTFVVDATSTLATTSASLLTTTGKAGVGTSTPLAWLTVNGLDAVSDLFRIATTTNQNMFVVKNDGKVGIGTSNPTEALEVHGNVYVTGNLTALGTTTSVAVTNLAVSDKNIYLASSTAPTDLIADGGGLILKASTTKSILWDLASDLWQFSHGIDIAATSTTSTFRGSLSAATTTLATTTISLLNVTGTSTAANAVVSGKLAIGTTTPGSILHVVGTGSQMRIQGTSGADYADIIFNNASDTTSSAYSTSTWQLSRRSTGELQFANYPGSTFTARTTFAGTGKVGFGDTNPSAWLSLKGSDATSDLFKIASTTNNNILVVDNKGFLGLGTTTPGSMLTVVGNSWLATTTVSNFTATATSTLATTTIAQLTVAGSSTLATTSVTNFTASATSTFWGKVGLGTSSPLAWFTVNGTDSTSDLLRVSTSTNNNILVVNNKGFLGLGTSTQNSLLTVAGDSWFTATSTFMGNVGIGTSNPQGAKLAIENTGLKPSLLVGGAVAFTAGNVYQPAVVRANDAIFGNTSVVRVDAATSSFAGITGIADITGTSTAHTDGQLLTIINASSTSAFYLYNQSASSTAANRIITGTGGDIQIAGDASVLLSYDGTSERWRVIGAAGGSSETMVVVSASTDQTLSTWGRTIMMNASSGNKTVTLPTAFLNEGTSIEVIKTDNSANVVIVKPYGTPTPTENINGSTNSIYLYGQGDSIVLRSDGTDVQIIADNRSSVGQSKSYLRAGRPISQTTGLTTNSPVVFTSVSGSYGSDIELNPTTGIFTLKAGKTYHLRGTPGWVMAGANVNASFQWYDITNSTGLGNAIQFVGATADVSTTEADAVVTPATDITVRLSITSLATMTQIGDGASRNPFAFIEVLSTPANTTSVVDYGFYGMSAGQTISGTPFDITNMSTKISGNMPAATGGIFSLTAGKTYELEASLYCLYVTTGGDTNWAWVDSATNTQLPGSILGQAIGASASPGTYGSYAPAKTIYTPTTNQTIKLRSTSSTNQCTVAQDRSYVKITQIGTTATTGLPFNYISQALAAGTLDNTNFNQDWNWSTLTTTNGLDLAANALTTGSILTLTTSNATASSTNGLLYVGNTGSSANGIVARIQSNSTAGSGLTVFANGKVSLGTTAKSTGVSVDLALNDSTNGSGLQMSGNGNYGGAITGLPGGAGLKFYYYNGAVGSETFADTMSIGYGIVMSGATGGDKGLGTITATQVYANSTQLTSDARLKTNVLSLNDNRGLGLIQALNPVSFNWKDQAMGTTTNLGFIAQEVQALAPELVNVGPDASSTLSMNYIGLIPVTIKAMQEQNVLIFGTSTSALSFAASVFPNGIAPALAALASTTDAQMKALASSTSITAESLASLASSTALTVGATGEKTFVGAFFDRLIAWLGDATNGIQTIVANVFKAKEVQTDKLCVGSTCVTESQLIKLLSGQQATGATSATTPSTTTTTSTATTLPTTATLTLNGPAIATLNIGDAWTDIQGASFIHDGALDTIYSTSSVNTLAVGTTTLDYFATYYSAASSTLPIIYHITRDVVVVDPAAVVATTTPVADTAAAAPADTTPAPVVDTTVATPAVDAAPAPTADPAATPAADPAPVAPVVDAASVPVDPVVAPTDTTPAVVPAPAADATTPAI